MNYRDIRDLNPHLYAGEMYAQSILYDTLVSITDDGYEGCLAESWTISEDGCVYTFNIRDEVYFSDGTLCDADAIAIVLLVCCFNLMGDALRDVLDPKEVEK